MAQRENTAGEGTAHAESPARPDPTCGGKGAGGAGRRGGGHSSKSSTSVCLGAGPSSACGRQPSWRWEGPGGRLTLASPALRRKQKWRWAGTGCTVLRSLNQAPRSEVTQEKRISRSVLVQAAHVTLTVWRTGLRRGP